MSRSGDIEHDFSREKGVKGERGQEEILDTPPNRCGFVAALSGVAAMCVSRTARGFISSA